MARRPTGVTVLAILQIIAAITFLLVSLGMFLVATLAEMEDVRDAIGEEAPEWVFNNFEILFGAMGAVFLILALAGFGIAYGFLKGIGRELSESDHDHDYYGYRKVFQALIRNT